MKELTFSKKPATKELSTGKQRVGEKGGHAYYPGLVRPRQAGRVELWFSVQREVTTKGYEVGRTSLGKWGQSSYVWCYKTQPSETLCLGMSI